jgi:hypothetical protein
MCRFGFPTWVDWKKLIDFFEEHGLDALKPIATSLRSQMHDKLRYATNSRRSAVAAYLQENLTDVGVAFCAQFDIPHRPSCVHGLRECLRFLYALSSIKDDTFNRPKRCLPGHNKTLCEITREHTREMFDFFGLDAASVFVTEHDSGVLYCPMQDLLHPTDTAYWWVHPGVMVQLQNLPIELCSTLISAAPRGRTIELYIGSTSHQAYSAAAAHSKDRCHLLERLANRELAVASWTFMPSDRAWGFECGTINSSTL